MYFVATRDQNTIKTYRQNSNFGKLIMMHQRYKNLFIFQLLGRLKFDSFEFQIYNRRH